MNPEELAKLKTLFALYKRLRRENDALRAENAALKAGLTADARAFDEENRGLFAVVHENHRVRAPKIEVFSYGQSRRN